MSNRSWSNVGSDDTSSHHIISKIAEKRSVLNSFSEEEWRFDTFENKQKKTSSLTVSYSF